MNESFERTLRLRVSPQETFAWHARRSAFERLVPPWLPVSIEQRPPALEDETHLAFRVRKGPGIRWLARHEEVRPGRSFVDVQERGPFAFWRHEHLFEASPGGSRLIDRISYRLPAGGLGRLVAGRFVRADLEAMFAYRHHVTWHDLELHRRLAAPPRRIALRVGRSPASQRLAATLFALLDTGGHEVVRVEGEAATTGDPDVWVDLDPAGREARLAGAETARVVTALGEGPARADVHLRLAALHPAPRPWFRRAIGGPDRPWVSVDDAAAALAFGALSENLRGECVVAAPDETGRGLAEEILDAGFRFRHHDWHDTCRRYEGRERRAWSAPQVLPESRPITEGR